DRGVGGGIAGVVVVGRLHGPLVAVPIVGVLGGPLPGGGGPIQGGGDRRGRVGLHVTLAGIGPGVGIVGRLGVGADRGHDQAGGVGHREPGPVDLAGLLTVAVVP